MENLVWLVPLFPLLGFALIGLLNRSLSKGVTGMIASGSVLLSFVVSLSIFVGQAALNGPKTVKLFDWITAGNFSASFSFLVDPLSAIFLMVITGVGFLIHVYSTGYMHDDDGFRRFFAYLNLFIFFMLLLVLGDNFLVMFVGWEGVGLCSYLLIGFWFKNPAYASAAKKAFVMNRIGDLGFLLGIFMIYTTFGSITYNEVFPKVGTLLVEDSLTAISIAFLLFVGAMGKSAQVPLYTWLPDAMAGPTPVSALIHAATMVTAGIYMIARSNALYVMAPTVMDFVAFIGILTALMAASIGIFQNDIKKVLAYSTVSQLGLMFVALGVGAFSTAVFHVVTHAFFKALLFLGSGSVIHAMGGEQDIRRMGGLKKYLPTTYWTFLVGTLAISGIPIFAGFFSKDEILASTFHHNIILYILASVASAMTAFYMFRLLYLTFFGDFRGTHEQQHHLHESPASMTVPLMVLAVLSTIGGFMGFPHGLGHALHIPHALGEMLSPVTGRMEGEHSVGEEMMLMVIATGIAVAMWLWARSIFTNKNNVPIEDAQMTGFPKLVYEKYRVDEIYNTLITKPLDMISTIFYTIFDKGMLDGLVNGVGSLVTWLSGQMRLVQNGSIGFYLYAMVLGIILILLYGLF